MSNFGLFTIYITLIHMFKGGSVLVERLLSGGRDLISLCHASLGAKTIEKLMPYCSLLLFEHT